MWEPVNLEMWQSHLQRAAGLQLLLSPLQPKGTGASTEDLQKVVITWLLISVDH